MLYREIIAVCSEIHTKHKNTLCGQNVELLNVTNGGMVTTGLHRANQPKDSLRTHSDTRNKYRML